MTRETLENPCQLKRIIYLWHFIGLSDKDTRFIQPTLKRSVIRIPNNHVICQNACSNTKCNMNLKSPKNIFAQSIFAIHMIWC